MINVLIKQAIPGLEMLLAEIRANVMRESLASIGRYDEIRVRRRLLDTYNVSDTQIIYMDNELIGFYVIEDTCECYYLRHFYIIASKQGLGIGAFVMNTIKKRYCKKTIRLNALKNSKANQFYLNNGFRHTGSEEFDNNYEFK